MQTANEVLDNLREVPLAGIAIGNGWIDSRTQYPAYIEYALKVGLFKEGSDVSFGFHTLSHPSSCNKLMSILPDYRLTRRARTKWSSAKRNSIKLILNQLALGFVRKS